MRCVICDREAELVRGHYCPKCWDTYQHILFFPEEAPEPEPDYHSIDDDPQDYIEWTTRYSD